MAAGKRKCRDDTVLAFILSTTTQPLKAPQNGMLPQLPCETRSRLRVPSATAARSMPQAEMQALLRDDMF